MYRESILRWATLSVGTIQAGPEVELEPSTPAVSQRQGLTSPERAERGSQAHWGTSQGRLGRDTQAQY